MAAQTTLYRVNIEDDAPVVVTWPCKETHNGFVGERCHATEGATLVYKHMHNNAPFGLWALTREAAIEKYRKFLGMQIKRAKSDEERCTKYLTELDALL
jgi:hypothetical protein